MHIHMHTYTLTHVDTNRQTDRYSELNSVTERHTNPQTYTYRDG